MSNHNGWVSLHRAILDWEWYSDINATRLFIHCLIRANHEPKSWRGIDIKRGSFYTSLETLSVETKLSIKQIRTAFSKLERTGEVASLGQARGRMVTIVNYESYQQEGKQKGGKKGKVGATNNNDNKQTIDNITTLFYESGMTEFQITELNRIRKVNKGGKITERVATSLIKEFKLAVKIGWQLDDSLTEWESRGWKSFKSEWITPKIQGASNEINQRPTTARPDNSAAGRVRANVAKRRAEIASQLEEVGRHIENVEPNVIDVWP